MGDLAKNRKRKKSRQEAQGQFDRAWDAKGYSGEKANSAERMAAQNRFNQRWDAKETRYVQSVNKAGKAISGKDAAAYARGLNSLVTLPSARPQNFANWSPQDQKKYARRAMTGDPLAQPKVAPFVRSANDTESDLRDYARNYEEEIKRRSAEAGDDNIVSRGLAWLSGNDEEDDGSIFRNIRRTTMAPLLSVAAGSMEYIDEEIYKPWNHFLAGTATFLNPQSEAWLDRDKASDATNDLSVGQALSANPLFTGSLGLPVSMAGRGLAGGQSGLTTVDGQQAILLRGQPVPIDELLRNPSQLDPADPEERRVLKQIMEQSWGGRYLSASSDFAAAIVADPLVYAGKGIKVGRVALMGAKGVTTAERAARISALTDIRARLNDLDDVAELAKAVPDPSAQGLDKAGAALKAARDNRAARQAKTRGNKYQAKLQKSIEDLAKIDDTKTALQSDWVKTASNPEAAAFYVTQAKSPDEIIDMMMVHLGDEQSIIRLQNSERLTLDAQEALRNVSDSVLKGATPEDIAKTTDFAFIRPWLNPESPTFVDDMDTLMSDLAQRDSKLAAIIGRPDENIGGEFFGGIGSSSTAKNAPRVKPTTTIGGVDPLAKLRQSDEVRLRRMQKKGEATVDTFRHGPAGTPINIVRWAKDQAPSGLLRISGSGAEGSGINEWIASLNSINLYNKIAPGMKTRLEAEGAVGVTNSELRKESRAFGVERKSEFIDRYVKASADGPIALRAEVEKMQREIAEDHAAYKADLWLGPKPEKPVFTELPPDVFKRGGNKPFQLPTPKDIKPDYGWVQGAIRDLRAEFGVRPPRKSDYVDPSKANTADAIAARQLGREAMVDVEGRRIKREQFKGGDWDKTTQAAGDNRKLRADRETNARIEAAIKRLDGDLTYDNLGHLIDTFMHNASKEQIAKLKALRSEAKAQRKVQWEALRDRRLEVKRINKELKDSFESMKGDFRDARTAQSEAQARIAERYKERLTKWEADNKAREDWITKFTEEHDKFQGAMRENIQKTIDRKGYWVEGSQVYKAPQWESHLADSIPLMDWKHFDYVTDEPGMAKSLRNAGYNVGTAWNKVQQVWRMSVLMRLGYTTRNLLEGNLRALAVVGAAQLDPESLTNFAPGAVRKAEVAASRISGRSRRLNAKAGNLHKELAPVEQARARARAAESKLMELENRLDEANPGTDLSHRLTMRKAKVQGELDALNANLAELSGDSRVGTLRAELAEVDQKVNRLSRPIPRASDSKVNVGGTAFDGLTGDPSTKDMMSANISATGTNRFAAGLAVDNVYRDNARMLREINTEIPTTDKNYIPELTKIYNNTLRNDPLARLRLQHAQADTVVPFVNSPQGKGIRELAELNGVNWKNPDELMTWVNQGADFLDSLVPTPALRKLLLNGETITPARLRMEVEADLGTMPNIVGDRLAFEHGHYKKAIGRWKALVDGAWDFIATIPEDKFVRTPYANAIYNKTLAEYAQTYSPEFIAKNRANLQRNAQRQAIRAVKRDQYTIERYSNLGKIVENFSPFISAKLNSARFWGKTVANDPSVMARGMQLWGLPEDTGMADENGVFHLPVGWLSTVSEHAGPIKSLPFVGDKVANWRNLKDTDTLEFSKEGVLSIILNPNPGLAQLGEDGEALPKSLPGLVSLVSPEPGGLAAVPIHWGLRKYAETGEVGPFMDAVTKILAPYGIQDDVFNAMVPTWMRDMRNVLDSESSGEKRDAAYSRVQYEMYKEWIEGGQKPEDKPTPGKVAARVDALLGVKIIGSLTMPGAVKVKTALDPILDYRNMLYDAGLSSEAVDWAIGTKFGEEATLLMRGTGVFGSTELPRTMATVKFLKENADWIGEVTGGNIEEIKFLLGQQDGLEGPYNPLAAQVIGGMEIPGTGGRTFGERLNFDEAQEQLDMARGRKEWQSYKVWEDAEFERANAKLKPGEKLSSEFWDRRNYVKNVVVEKLREINPTYAETYNFGQDNPKRASKGTEVLRKVIASPQYEQIKQQNRQFWAASEVFLEERDKAYTELLKDGITDVNDGYRKFSRAKSDVAERERIEEVKLKLSNKVKRLRRKSIHFSDMWDMWFAGDDFAKTYYGARKVG